MSKKIRGISDPKLSINVLSSEQIISIHEATLNVLENVGVRFPSFEALEILQDNGALVDMESMVARFPGEIIMKFLTLAPSTYKLAALDPDLDLELDGNHSYLGTDGCGVGIIDIHTNVRRRTNKQDIEDIARVADYLDEIAFHWVPVSAQDCPPYSRSLHELEAIWGVSQKHIQTESIVSRTEMETAVEMAVLMTGNRDNLRKRPILSIMQCTLSPLCHDAGSLDAALVAARSGLPVGFMTMVSAGSTGPITLAGSLVVGNAEVLAALVLMQMAAPGCPVFYAAAQTAVDLRTGSYTGGGPEDFLFGAATNLLADFYGLPLSMGAYATGAKEPDWQAAVDNSFSSFMAVSTLSDMLLGAGLLHGSRIFSYEMLVMDVEIWGILENMFRGVDVSEETIALGVINSIGQGGTYLSHKHTRDNMRKRWLPTIFDRTSYEVWDVSKSGARNLAHQKALKIYNEYRPEPLNSSTKHELQKIIKIHENNQ